MRARMCGTSACLCADTHGINMHLHHDTESIRVSSSHSLCMRRRDTPSARHIVCGMPPHQHRRPTHSPSHQQGLRRCRDKQLFALLRQGHHRETRQQTSIRALQSRHHGGQLPPSPVNEHHIGQLSLQLCSFECSLWKCRWGWVGGEGDPPSLSPKAKLKTTSRDATCK